jgi:aldehyde:ferredoxin oxidoreductase
MPQAKRSLGLIYAVNPFGADHQSSEHDPMVEEGASDLYMGRLKLLGFDHTLAPRSLDHDKVRFALKTQQFYSFLDSADLCQFVWGPAWTLYGPQEAVDMVKAITGWNDFTLDELMTVGERRLNMLRAFNAREGIDRKADKLPKKFFKALAGTGPTANVALTVEEMERAQDMYYEMSGWDKKTGNPTHATLERLELGWVLGEPPAVGAPRRGRPAVGATRRGRLTPAKKKAATKAKKPAKKAASKKLAAKKTAAKRKK